MRQLFCSLLLLLGSNAAIAEETDGFIHGGIGVAMRQPDHDPPWQALQPEYQDGTTLFATFATRYPMALVRVDYSYTIYDALTGTGGTIAEDIQQHNADFGVFFAPRPGPRFGYRLGGGYTYSYEIDSADASRIQDGPFLEAAGTMKLGRRLSLELAAATMKLSGKNNYDADGNELRLTAAWRVGGAELTLGGRALLLDRESPWDENVYEIRAGVRTAWNFPD